MILTCMALKEDISLADVPDVTLSVFCPSPGKMKKRRGAFTI